MDLKYFTLDEFRCSHTGDVLMNETFLRRLDALRGACNLPFVITSGYRSPDHPAEASKEAPGTHSRGIAADIRVTNGSDRRTIVEEALKMGFKGIGVAKTFVHVDDRDTHPVMWTYDD